MRRMIDPQLIIKSQVVDDKYEVYLYEILEKYGAPIEFVGKTITLQIYNKFFNKGGEILIEDDNDMIAYILPNTIITMTKNQDGNIIIAGSLIDDLDDMNLMPYAEIIDGDYENGISLNSTSQFDIYVIRV